VIRVRNGWNFPLVGLTAKWDMFAKTGKTSSSVVLLKSGAVEAMNLKPGQAKEFETSCVEFRGTDSSSAGFKGNKYYGYRVRFYYRKTLVKVVSLPSRLTDWESLGGGN